MAKKQSIGGLLYKKYVGTDGYKMYKECNLLVITLNYSSYVKDPVDLICNNFNYVNVFVRHNPIAEISNYIPINYLKPHRLKYLIDYTTKPDNLTVFPTSVPYIPIDMWHKRLGDQNFRVVNARINKNKLKFDLIHSHFIWTPGYVGVKLKEKYNVPLIITGHGFDVYNLPFIDDEWTKKIEEVLNHADIVITVSRRNAQYLQKLKIQTPVKVIPNGFKRELFYRMDQERTKEILRLPRNKKIIFTAGHLKPMKGHRFLVEAMSTIIKDKKDILCLIAGSGSQKNNLQRLIKKLNVQDYIKLVGEKTHSEIPLWINACDLFVLPSLNEGNPTVLFEALGCGKPFIGTNVGGIPEIIISDEYGFLCKPGDPEDLAEKILIALDKKWDYENIVKYSERYTWNNIVKKILEVYSKVLGK